MRDEHNKKRKCTECQQLRAQLDQAVQQYKVDAERYRWLTSEAADGRLAESNEARQLIHEAWAAVENSNDKAVIDAEIDAAMGKK